MKSKADKMFLKMKYVKSNSFGRLNYVKLSKGTLHYIRFYEKKKSFWAFIFTKKGEIKRKKITMYEFRAINEKIKELRWLDEKYKRKKITMYEFRAINEKIKELRWSR